MSKFIISSMLAMTMSAVLVIEAKGQDFVPLAQWLTQPEGKKNKIYAFERCAALNTAILAHGEKNIDSETVQSMDEKTKTFLALAVMLSKKQNGSTLEANNDQVDADTTRVAKIYLDRLKNNYASTGLVFGNDELIKSDLKICKEVSDSLAKSGIQ